MRQSCIVQQPLEVLRLPDTLDYVKNSSVEYRQNTMICEWPIPKATAYVSQMYKFILLRSYDKPKGLMNFN